MLSSFFFLNLYKFDSLYFFLINYHIYVVLFICYFAICIGLYSYLYKYGLFYSYMYMYMYWFIYINVTCVYISMGVISVLHVYWYIVIKMFVRLNLFLLDIRYFLFDVLFYTSGFIHFFTKPTLFLEKFSLLFTQFNDRRKYILKKYVYTINHKRIAINYFIFSMWTALSGAALATMIRLELAFPGSPFFKGDSTRYLQTITAHGLIMVFFVVVPILFGGFANFLIPYHVGSKDVAYPRLNSIGF